MGLNGTEGNTMNYLQDVVDSAVELLGLLEKGVQLGPVGDVGLDKGGFGPGGVGRGRNIRVDDRGADREQESHRGEADT